MSFDLTRPVLPQLEDAKRLIEEETGRRFYDDELDVPGAPMAPKIHVKKWLTYLRLLDAKAAGASLSEMSQVILAGTNTRADQRTAGNMLKQAEEQMFRF